MPYERRHITALTPYTPGEQPAAADIVKLNTNENPYPPAEAVMQAVREVTGEALRRYPSPHAGAFRALAADMHGLQPQQVIATNGGDELLRMLITVFCEPNGPGQAGGLGVTRPSYSLYPVLAAIHHTALTEVELDDAFGLPADLAEQWNLAECRLGIVVNPHAPSGRREPLEVLLALARDFRGVLVIDEAYVDFADGDALALVQDGGGLDNVILLRTLSKGYGLAGLRFGYGLGHASLITALDKVRDSYNTDALSQAAAVAALRHRQQAAQTWAKVIASRNQLAGELETLGFEVYPSQSNFLLARPGDGQARQLYERLAKQSIYVRYFDQDRLRDKLRITVGTPDQNQRLLAALRTALAAGV